MEDAEVLPFPTTRQTLQEMLLDEEEKDFWDEAELAPSQEPATREAGEAAVKAAMAAAAADMAAAAEDGMEEEGMDGLGGVRVPEEKS